MIRSLSFGILATALVISSPSAVAQNWDSLKREANLLIRDQTKTQCDLVAYQFDDALNFELQYSRMNKQQYQIVSSMETDWNKSACAKLTGKLFIEMLDGKARREYELRLHQTKAKEGCANFMIANGEKVCI